VDGDDVGLVHFTFKQLDGTRVGASISDLMCAPQTTLLRGTAATFRPGESIGWVDYDPDASFDTQPSADRTFTFVSRPMADHGNRADLGQPDLLRGQPGPHDLNAAAATGRGALSRRQAAVPEPPMSPE